MTVESSLVTDHLSIVSREASRIARRPEAREELEGWGALGLIEAAHRWDPELGVPFGAYARIRIRGAMLDASRRWFLGPRGRPVTVVSIDVADRPEPAEIDEALITAQKHETVRNAVSFLPLNEREVIVKAYWQGKTLTEIAQEAGVSLSRISNLHTRAVKRLREALV